MAAIGGLALCGETSEAAQRFRATPLVKLDFQPDVDSNGSMGINNKGQVVYGFDSGDGALHAWVWLPEADNTYISGLNTAGVHDLTAFFNRTAPEIARDINESGVVVGQSGSYTRQAGVGIVWRLTETSNTVITLGVLDSNANNPYSSLHGVSDNNPPIVVGESNTVHVCDCNQQSNQTDELQRAFYAAIDVTNNTLIPLSLGSHTVNAARDVAKINAQGGFDVVGRSDCLTVDQDGFCRNFVDFSCFSSVYPAFWDDQHSLTDLDRLETHGTWAQAINADGKSVGYSRVSAFPFNGCFSHATLWPDSSSSPVDLHDGLLDPTDSSRAEGMNNLNNPQIVGSNTSTLEPLLWETDGSTWSVLNLNTAAAIGSSYSQYGLREAHDINDNSWIVCIGDFFNSSHNELSGVWAILLTPYVYEGPCVADIDLSGKVDVIDLLAVLNHWGSCIAHICGREDINTDSFVDVQDLLAVTTAWGECGGSTFGPPETVEDCESTCAQQYPGGGPDYAACVAGCVDALCKEGKLSPGECP